MRAYNIWRQSGRSSLQCLFSLGGATPSPAFLPSNTSFFATQARSPLEILKDAISRIVTPPTANYPTHVPLSPLQKGALGVLASLGAFSDPRRGDLVAVVGETTGVPALRAIRDRMQRSPEGQQLLLDKPRITDQTVSPCWDLPSTTFGGAYAEFMGARGFRADERPTVKFVGDPELAWVVARIREVHDFWHVLFGCHTDVFGETALKAVEFVQTGLPMTGMAVVAGEFKMRSEDRRLMNQVFLPWAVRAGAQAADLMTIYYEKHFDEDLEELRKRWRIMPAPKGQPVRGRQNARVVASAQLGKKVDADNDQFP